jgi:hypothetical protein
VQYELGAPVNIDRIHILSGNNGKDGRVFSTTVVRTSTNGGATFDLLGYFQSDPSGSGNPAPPNDFGSTLVEIFDDAGGLLAGGVTDLQFDFYAVSNTAREMRDPFDAANPFTGSDDGIAAAFESPLIFEIDVQGTIIPEPATWVVICLGLVALFLARRSGR